MTASEIALAAATVAGGVLAGAALLAVAFLLTVGTFTSVRSLIRHPLSTLPTEPIDMDAPPRRPVPRRRRAQRRAQATTTDLRAVLRDAVSS